MKRYRVVAMGMDRAPQDGLLYANEHDDSIKATLDAEGIVEMYQMEGIAVVSFVYDTETDTVQYTEAPGNAIFAPDPNHTTVETGWRLKAIQELEEAQQGA